MNNTLLITIGIAVVIINAASFWLMRYDKQCARQNKRRVPERTLFLVTGLFGGLGGVLGMWLCRHKTKHWYFRLFFSMMLVAQIAVLVFLFMKLLR